MKKKADMLKGLEMPKKKMAEEEAAMDLEGLGEEDLDIGAPTEGEPMEVEEGVIEDSPFMQFSDEELIDEMKKRGLIEGGEIEAKEADVSPDMEDSEQEEFPAEEGDDEKP